MGNGIAEMSVWGWFFLHHGGETVLNSPRAQHPMKKDTMKIRHISLAVAGIALALASTSRAAVSILDPAYAFSIYHTHSVASSAVVSFDWDADGAVYYQASTDAYGFGGLFAWNGITQSTMVAGSSDFSGASVVRIGDNIYFNTSDFTDQKVFKFGPLGGAPSVTNISTAVNSGLYGRGAGEMFIAGAPGFGTNQIYRVTLDGSGNFASAPASLGLTIGSSGPIAFDLSGNMYFAPGFGNLGIYKYTAAEVAAAIADPLLNPLPAAGSRLWHDYSGDLSVSGATGMTFDGQGNLLLTLTDFVNPSLLVRFDVDGAGDFGGLSEILFSTDRLGDVRYRDGAIYVGNANTILQVVPEPGTFGLLVFGGLAAAWLGRRLRAGTRG